MRQPTLPINQIIHGNCIDIMHDLPEESVDVIFADPPYNLQLQKDLWRPNLTRVDAVDDEWDQFDTLETYDQFTTEWLQAARRLLKPQGTIWVIGSYHNIYRVGKVLMDLSFWILNDIVWIKTNPMPNFRGVRFTNAHETIIWAQKNQGEKYTFNYQMMKSLNGDLQMRSDWVLPICTGKERLTVDGEKIHSTQKPEALLQRVIASSTNAKDIILDPFFGTGTTGAVAKRLHRNFIGIEQNEDYIAAAQQRIDNIQPPAYSSALYEFPDSRKLPRVAFAKLLEHGLVSVGQTLYFNDDNARVAVILANGKLQYKNEIGSIHQLGKKIKRGPCNGWLHWYYEDPESGKHLVIDVLRDKFRKLMAVAEENS